MGQRKKIWYYLEYLLLIVEYGVNMARNFHTAFTRVKMEFCALYYLSLKSEKEYVMKNIGKSARY